MSIKINKRTQELIVIQRNVIIQRNTAILVEFSLFAIDYMRIGPLVMSQKRSDICGIFFESDILSCLTSYDL